MVRKPHCLVQGRRGGLSVVDALISRLWQSDNVWPSKSLSVLTRECVDVLGYAVSNSTVRATVYRYPEFFERDDQDGVKYHLSSYAIECASEK